MTKVRKFFIIPGFKEQVKDEQYSWLLSYIKRSGWKPVEVPIVWNYKTLSQNASEFIDFYNKHKGVENQILGFSYGAVITLLCAEALKPNKIYLCSLSPDFKEDRQMMPSWLKGYIGKRRFDDTATRSAEKISKALTIPTVIFHGEEEGRQYPSLKKRCEETAKYAKNAKLIIIPDAPHKIDFPAYQSAIKQQLGIS